MRLAQSSVASSVRLSFVFDLNGQDLWSTLGRYFLNILYVSSVNA
jgi:hypothetical protein